MVGSFTILLVISNFEYSFFHFLSKFFALCALTFVLLATHVKHMMLIQLIFIFYIALSFILCRSSNLTLHCVYYFSTASLLYGSSRYFVVSRLCFTSYINVVFLSLPPRSSFSLSICSYFQFHFRLATIHFRNHVNLIVLDLLFPKKIQVFAIFFAKISVSIFQLNWSTY